jgi:hypothetical protein
MFSPLIMVTLSQIAYGVTLSQSDDTEPKCILT